MKLLLYCTKGKPLFRSSGDYDDDWGFNNFFDEYVCARDYYNYHNDYETVDEEDLLNGKIIAECDYEVEEIKVKLQTNYYFYDYFTDTLQLDYLLEDGCLSYYDLDIYLRAKCGKAIHIKNLHIFDKPKELSEYYNRVPMMYGDMRSITSAPQNMRYVEDYFGHKYVLISIRPEWLVKILNGEKTIEVRKRVLKEM